MRAYPVAEHVAGAAAGLPGLAAIIALDNGSIPVTFNGKRSEAAARDAMNGRPARNRDALQNPECLDAIAKHPVVRASAAIKASRGPAPGRGAIPDGVPLRRELQAVCERVLGVSPISWSDNLLGFGADSLAVVNLLLEIEDHVGRPLPFSALLSAPSIEGLAAALPARTR
jgi:acetoacetyl-CoA synthetase